MQKGPFVNARSSQRDVKRHMEPEQRAVTQHFSAGSMSAAGFVPCGMTLVH